MAEVSAHGSPVVLAGILRRAIEAGARLAEPGEFTLRAFLNGKLDLVQAEAVADLIDAVTPLQARAAFDQLEGTLTEAIGVIEAALFDVTAKLEASLDFPDEGYHFLGAQEAGGSIRAEIARLEALLARAGSGRLIREGAQVAIVGAPNVGKSSLFNLLLNANRAIVTAVPGTTRDLLTERADIGGLALSLIDTAGVRETADEVEREGVERARATVAVADFVLLVLDRSRPLDAEDRELIELTSARSRVVVWNKSDLADGRNDGGPDGIEICARSGDGVTALVESMAGRLGATAPRRDEPMVTNIRHVALLERARESLLRAATALGEGITEEFPLADLHDASEALQEVTGRRTSDDLLRHIFQKFCIGK